MTRNNIFQIITRQYLFVPLLLPLFDCPLNDFGSEDVLAVDYVPVVVVQPILISPGVFALQLFQLYKLYDLNVVSFELLLNAVDYVDEVFRTFF